MKKNIKLDTILILYVYLANIKDIKYLSNRMLSLTKGKELINASEIKANSKKSWLMVKENFVKEN